MSSSPSLGTLKATSGLPNAGRLVPFFLLARGADPALYEGAAEERDLLAGDADDPRAAGLAAILDALRACASDTCRAADGGGP